MTNILVVFYSRDGSTERLAEAVSEGARDITSNIRMRRVRELVDTETMAAVPGWREAAERMNAVYPAPTPSDVEWADAIIFGSPTRFGLMASELKAFLDSLGALWMQGKLVGKVGSAFTSTSSTHGGNEMNSFTMFAPMAHFGMLIVPPGYADPVMFKAGTPYGASSVSDGAAKRLPNEDELASARFQGRHVASVAQKLTQAASHA